MMHKVAHENDDLKSESPYVYVVLCAGCEL
jgi:hypothetical protein